MIDRSPRGPKRRLRVKRVERPSFESIALAIGDARLETTLRDLACRDNLDEVIEQGATLRKTSFIEIETRLAELFPKRFKIRAEIKDLKVAAEKFGKALGPVSKLLLGLPVDADLSLLGKAREVSKEIRQLCDSTLSINPAKAGAPRIPGRLTCATIIIEAWASVRGKAPGHNNEIAQKACADYWRLCGGTGGDGEYTWDRYITAARKSRSNLRRYIHDEITRLAGGTE